MRIGSSSAELCTAATDLRSLLRFRASMLTDRDHRRLVVGGLVVGLLTLSIVLGAAWLPGDDRPRAVDVKILLPSAMVGFLALVVVSAAASGGGREVIPRDQAVAFPVSATTEHLGAMLMAPLNIAWLMQTWLLLGAAAYADGPRQLWAVELTMLVWVVMATVAAQLLGWMIEGLRRGRHGIVAFRVLVAGAALAMAVLVGTARLAPFMDAGLTRRLLFVVIAAPEGRWGEWATGTLVLAAAAVVLGYAGAVAAGWALTRPEREELRLESGRRRPGRSPQSGFAALVHIDRASVWRSVPLRRGIVVLAVMPGAVALAGSLDWQLLTILPGLVVSGAALLFGINAWCLDGRGVLWRESLPGAATLAYWARTLVLAEVLAAAAIVTMGLALLRAGRPTPSEAVAMVCATVVVIVQVVATSMRWSVARPFASDLRSARATPAPPVVMVGYSARLAWWTTVTGMFFSLLARQPDWRIPMLAGIALTCHAGYRLLTTSRTWDVPEVRARVVATVAG